MSAAPTSGEAPSGPARAAVVLLAAGAGNRVGAEVNKILLPLDARPVLAHGLRTVLALENVHRIVVVVRPGDREAVVAALEPHLGTHDLWLVDGGAERHDSEARALDALRAEILAGEIDIVALHDAARPLATVELFTAVIDAASRYGAAVPVLRAGPLSSRDGTAAPGDLVAVQTPQAFAAGTLLEAYDAAAADGFAGTDTAACLERYSSTGMHAIPGEATNLKITFPEDVAFASVLITPARD